MNEKLRHLAQRREHLVAQAAQQRLLLGQNIETCRAPIALVERGLAVVSYIKRHSILAAGVSLGLYTVMHSSRTTKWFRRGWLMWQVVRKLRGK